MKRINGQSNQRFSIRKCTIGAVSVLLGTFLVVGVNQVSADEQVVAPTSSEVTAGFVVDTKANQTVTTPVVTSDTEQTPTQAESTPATPTTTQAATPTTEEAIVTTPIAEADTTKTMIPVVENETSKQSTETSDVVAPETAEADKVTDLSVTTNTKESTGASLNTENVASRTTVEAPAAQRQLKLRLLSQILQIR
ncbi:YSIRK-type signal peptide-containing protein [uncultured Streptococcus sp.]|uniref:YSIRK-type signal peptide-containing protein n=1 Tax=uncultured Streptococcus sp. TaxID=83427 RepID=UPI0027DB046D|nr:YSIRK-type signal peptide-containing protein [uncultured Streptococcus sp.]